MKKYYHDYFYYYLCAKGGVRRTVSHTLLASNCELSTANVCSENFIFALCSGHFFILPGTFIEV